MITEFDGNKKTKDKWRQSIFLLTINTNKSCHTKEDCKRNRMPIIKQRLIKLLEDLLTKKNIAKLTVDLGKVGTKERIQIDPEHIKDIEVKSQIEQNVEKLGMLHSHSLIKITHNTRVQLDLVVMKRIIYQFMEPVLTFDGKFLKPYINLRAITNKQYDLDQYISDGKEITQIK